MARNRQLPSPWITLILSPSALSSSRCRATSFPLPDFFSCIYINIYAIHTHNTHIHTHIHTYIHTYIQFCVCLCVCVYLPFSRLPLKHRADKHLFLGLFLPLRLLVLSGHLARPDGTARAPAPRPSHTREASSPIKLFGTGKAHSTNP